MEEQKAIKSDIAKAFIHDLMCVLEMKYGEDFSSIVDADNNAEFMFKELTEQTEKSPQQEVLGLVHVDNEYESFYDVSCLKEISEPSNLSQVLDWINHLNIQNIGYKFMLLEPEDENSNYVFSCMQLVTCGEEVKDKVSVFRTGQSMHEQIIDIFGQIS